MLSVRSGALSALLMLASARADARQRTHARAGRPAAPAALRSRRRCSTRPCPRRCAPAATRISASPGRVSRRARRHDAA